MTQEKTALVLLTRNQQDCETLAQELLKSDIESISMPLLEIVFHPIDKNIITTSDALIFTSRNAVTSLTTQYDDIPKDTPAYAIGASTAAALKMAGFTRIDYSATSSASNLATKVAKSRKQNICYLRGRDIAFDISTQLNKQNPSATISEITTYSALPAKELSAHVLRNLKNKRITHIPLFSERTAKIFKQLLINQNLETSMDSTKCLCFSNKVLSSINDLNWYSTHTCPQPTMNNMIRLIQQTL